MRGGRSDGGGAGLPARLADGAAGPGARGQGGGAGGGLHRARVRLPAARGGLAGAGAGAAGRARPARRGRAGLRAGRAAGRGLRLQARAGARRRPREPAQVPAAAAPRPDRGDSGGAFPGDCGGRTGAAGAALRRGGIGRAGRQAVAKGGGARDRSLGQHRGHRALRPSGGGAARPAALLRARQDRARGPAHQGRRRPGSQGLLGPRDGAAVPAGVRALRAAGGPAPPRLRAPGAVGVRITWPGAGGTRSGSRRGWRWPPTSSPTASPARCATTSPARPCCSAGTRSSLPFASSGR